MRKITIAATVVLCLAQIARAESLANLRIVGEQVKISASESSHWLTLGIENTGIEERPVVWQVVFQIVPVDDSTGTVVIKDFARPPAYMFGDAAYEIIRSDQSPLGTTFSGATSDLAGAEVLSTGMNLLQIELASSDATGRFDIVAVSDEQIDLGSNWISPEFNAYEFAVVPVSDRPQTRVVASVEFISAPEPPSGLMLLAGVATLAVPWVARRKPSQRNGLPCSRRIVGSCAHTRPIQ
ncbi:MAG: hypothetical protein ACYC35_08385 [Pirellulales bacterium]